MGILCVFCVYDTIGNRCFEKTSFPKKVVKVGPPLKKLSGSSDGRFERYLVTSSSHDVAHIRILRVK